MWVVEKIRKGGKTQRRQGIGARRVWSENEREAKMKWRTGMEREWE